MNSIYIDRIDENTPDNETVEYRNVYNNSNPAFEEEYFNSLIEHFKSPWKKLSDEFPIIKELFDILVYTPNETSAQRIKIFGEEKFNSLLNSLGETKIKYSAAEHNGKTIFAETYSVNTISELLALELIKMLQAEIPIKKCQNCKNLFAQYSGHKSVYCTGTPAGENQPCTIIGPIRLFAQKTKEDPLLELYQRISKRIHARAVRTKKIKEFKLWSKAAKTIREEANRCNFSSKEMEKRLEQAASDIGI